MAYFSHETSEIYSLLKQLNRPQVFSVKGSIIWQFCYTLSTIDIIFQISQNSPKFGRQ